MEPSNGRKKWRGGDHVIHMPLNVPAAKEEVPAQYEHYLHLLQERNRLMRRLKQKDKKEIELEKKEKGFTLYLNNNDPKTRSHHQRSKTAGTIDQRSWQKDTFSDSQKVSKSAGQSIEKRRTWHIGSVEFTTADGKRQKVKAPDYLTGKYTDDFENSSDSDDGQPEIIYGMSSLNVTDSMEHSTTVTTPRRQKTSYLKRVVAAKREETETENRVTLKLEDVKKLRESLQMNKFIRQSLAMEVDSDESDEGSISPLSEEIEENISSDDGARGKEDKTIKPLNLLKPGDTLVLEFQSLPSTSAGSASRPLSANLRNVNTKADSKEEASAVIRAMQEENKKVELLSRASSRPLPQPKSASGTPRSLPSPSKGAVKSPLPVKYSSNSSQTTPEATVASSRTQLDLDGDSGISSVVERVLKMNPRQQKQLLQTLNHIDLDDKGFALSKASVVDNWASKAPVTDHVEVNLEILSNWGNSLYVGLTELEFFDESGCLIPVKPSDVSANGARGCSNKVEVLFNGKSKTIKERNMWSCKFDGHPIELSFLLVNPNPGKQFKLGSVKVWNWNNRISNLDIGVREVRIIFGGKAVFCGEVDKGCGNQVFDYSKHIFFSNTDSADQSQVKKSHSGLFLNLDRAHQPDTVVPSTHGSGRPSPNLMSPSRAVSSPTKGDNSILPSSGSHHTFRSISCSSQSSASSSGSAKVRGHSDDRMTEERPGEGHLRSETRTLIRPTVLSKQDSGGSGLSSPEVNITETDLSRMPERKRVQTPMKSKRVAARLNGRSSETENSSKSDSHESKPPLPPPQAYKPEDKPPTTTTRSAERSSSNVTKSKLSPKSSLSEPHMSPRVSTMSISSRAADTSQNKSKDGNSEEEQTLIDKIKNMGQSENKRKKDIPTWLKGDETTDSGGLGTHKKSSAGSSKKTVKPPGDEDLQKQLEEEFEKFSQVGNDSQNIHDEGNDLLPMNKAQKSRAKWRNREENLEESWGSLSFFNKSHRGRVSIDVGGDDLLDYHNSSKKAAAPASDGDTVPKIPITTDSWSDEEADFIIPELPYGKELVINIKTTWGDHHYVGLTGIEIFSSLGEKVQITKIHANPSDINVLPEYSKDPRVVQNLTDNVNRTRDDVHMWLTPFTAGKDHFVYLTFAKPCKLAMMRIWNYNKSRIHSYRGAKDVIIKLDGTEIFKGEIARACGGIEGGTEAFGDTILFTTDENILEAVSRSDGAFEGDLLGDDEDVPFERPSTADAEDSTRPFTRAAGLLVPEKSKSSTPRPGTNYVTSIGDVLVYKTNKLQLTFTATWGDLHYLGLTGLEVVGSEGESVPLTMNMFTAAPKDLRHLPGNERDDRTLDKLLDGTNVTCHDSHMWLIPYTQGETHTVTVTFPQQTLVTGIRIWNYNKSPEDTYRGAKVMHVQINDRTVSPSEGYLLRKGPGICHFDFAQEISFSNSSQSHGSTAADSNTVQNTDTQVQMPRGFIFQFQLFSTWGDQYYIGLNGLEFYDATFNKLDLTDTNIAAYPDSVNVLDNVNNDTRTPDKLIDGYNDTNDGRHMWLAPILPTIINRVYVIFDQPTSVSMIKLWNYSKTVSRGVKDFALLVDDLLVYNGTLQAVSAGAIGILPTCSASIPHHTVLFTDNRDIIHKEKNFIISNQTEDQDIQLLNDKKVVNKFTKPSTNKPVNQALRPKTSVTTTKMARR